MTLKSLYYSAAILLFTACAGELLLGAEIPCEAHKLCPENSPHGDRYPFCMTSQLWFEAQSASGAQGDVVGVTISLHLAPELGLPFNSISLAVCHDPSLTELVGGPVYAEELLARNPLLINFLPQRDDQDPTQSGDGFISDLGAMGDRSPVVGELPLMTVYYRLIGFPGERAEISLCDGLLVRSPRRPCNFNGITDTRILGREWPLLSTENQNASLTIRDGPATHPDRPPEPPEAVVYADIPTSDEVNLRLRIDNTVAVPGERGVPVDVFITADVEYTGVAVPIDFDERYVRVARVEDHFVAGAAPFDNEDALPGAQPDEGYVVIVSSLLGKRRIAPAGEQFHAATIYLDVLESAAEVSRTVLEVRSVGGRAGDAFIVVHHLSGAAAEKVEARGEFGAGEVDNGVLAIRASLETLAGDANFDGGFDISDPIAVLGYLFLGRSEPLCPPAADYDGDGQLVISDPIRMLSVLFTGQALPVIGGNGLIGCR